MRKVGKHATTIVLLSGVLLATSAASGACDPDTGAGTGGQGPIVQLPQKSQGLHLSTQWEPTASSVTIWWSIDGNGQKPVTVSGGSWSLDVIAKNRVALQMDWHGPGSPSHLYCHIQRGWEHREDTADVKKGEWSCRTAWTAGTVPNA